MGKIFQELPTISSRGQRFHEICRGLTFLFPGCKVENTSILPAVVVKLSEPNTDFTVLIQNAD